MADGNVLLQLPSEIWLEVLECLSLHEHERLRLVSREFNKMTTPSYFRTASFQFTRKSVNRLVQLSKHEYSRYVRRLVLCIRPKLADFNTFDQWTNDINYHFYRDLASRPLSGFFAQAEELDGIDIISIEEWEGLSPDTKRALYDAYEKERIEEFTDSASFLTQTLHPLITDNPSNPNSIFQEFQEAITSFCGLRSFDHEISKACKCRFWGRLPFSLQTVHQRQDMHVSRTAQALSLSLCLMVFGTIQNPHQNLHSMNISVGGPAFWGADCLRLLWEQQQSHFFSLAFLVSGFPNDGGSESRALLCSRVKTIEQSLRYLRELEFCVSKHLTESIYGDLTTPMLDFLCCGQNLRKIRLIFVRYSRSNINAWDGPERPDEGHCHLLQMLSERSAWPNLEELELEVGIRQEVLLGFISSLAPTLQRLALTRVELMGEGDSWEIALPRIVTICNLGEIRLATLFERVDGLLTKVWFPVGHSPRWKYDETRAKCIMDDLLRTKKLVTTKGILLYKNSEGEERQMVGLET